MVLMAGIAHEDEEEVDRHIIYQSEDCRVFLVDIPVSIAHAQGKEHDCSRARVLLSSEPLQKPYQSTEPKKSKKNSAAPSNFANGEESLHSVYALIARDALSEIKENLASSKQWCLPRELIWRAKRSERERGTKKRKRDNDNDNGVRNGCDGCTAEAEAETQTGRAVDEDEIKQCLISLQAATNCSTPPTVRVSACCDGSSDRAGAAPVEEWTGYIPTPSNHHSRCLTVSSSSSLYSSSSSDEEREFCFFIPAGSGFLIGDVQRTAHIVEDHQSTVLGQQKFDFILLDPPWPNKSAGRKRNYNLASDEQELEELLACIPVEAKLKPSGAGFVAVWITNAAKYRRLVLGAGGLFEKWNVRLVEEWVWIKVTASGEPVTAVDGVWRKPYEVLLIGRSCPLSHSRSPCTGEDASAQDKGAQDELGSIKRRAIVAVPDLHSRKPCVKTLLERTLLLQEQGEYAALEVFARYLVKGWFSWGDEVLKFNCDDYWLRGA